MTAVSVVAISIATVVAYRLYFQAHRVGVGPDIANRMIWPEYELPNDASDVTYHVDFGGCEAEFAVSESHFLNWCRARGWSPTRIFGSKTYFQPVLLPVDDTIVTDGYSIDIPDGEVVFDATRSRAAFWVSTFP